MCGQTDDRDLAGSWRTLQSPGGLPAVHDGHFKIHQDDIGPLADRHLTALLAVLRRQNLEIAQQLKSHFEHVDVVVIVFDVKHFDHDVASVPLSAADLVCTSRRMRSTNSVGWN